MTGELRQTIERLKAKMLVATDRFNIVRSQRDAAQERVAQLEKELDASRKTIEKLSQEVEFLRIATTIAPERKDVEQTRAMLSQLVREIDNCIADLKE